MITETNVVTGVRTEREYNAAELAAIEASKPTTAETAVAVSQAAKVTLVVLDARSIRAMREWVAAMPDAPLFLKTLEAEAIIERAKVTS